MKAVRFHATGGPEVLVRDEVEKPRPAPGEVLARVHVAGVNFADTLLRRGAYLTPPRLPETPGVEAAGVVEAVGDGVSEGLVGQRVAFRSQRCYAEYAAAPVRGLISLPEQISFGVGAALPLQALTAYHLLYTMDRVRPGMTVLVHAAAGGVGLLLVQMAKQAGARVLGTTSTQAKADLARRYGADEVVLYTRTDFVARVKELTGNRGVDLVLDSVGRATFTKSLQALAPFGHLIAFGMASGPPEGVNVLNGLMQKSLKVSAFWLLTALQEPELAERGVREVLDWVSGGRLRVHVGLQLPLEQASEAHRQMEGGATMGKVLLTVS